LKREKKRNGENAGTREPRIPRSEPGRQVKPNDRKRAETCGGVKKSHREDNLRRTRGESPKEKNGGASGSLRILTGEPNEKLTSRKFSVACFLPRVDSFRSILGATVEGESSEKEGGAIMGKRMWPSSLNGKGSWRKKTVRRAPEVMRKTEKK